MSVKYNCNANLEFMLNMWSNVKSTSALYYQEPRQDLAGNAVRAGFGWWTFNRFVAALTNDVKRPIFTFVT